MEATKAFMHGPWSTEPPHSGVKLFPHALCTIPHYCSRRLIQGAYQDSEEPEIGMLISRLTFDSMYWNTQPGVYEQDSKRTQAYASIA